MATLVAEFEKKVEALEAKGESFAALRELLQFARLNNIPRNHAVLRYGVSLLKHYSKLGDEGWNVLEQVFLAALACGASEVAEKLQSELSASSSTRLKLLVGRWKEYTNCLDEAESVYKQLLAANQANTVALKRLVAIARSRGKHGDAVVMINRYLNTFGRDTTAWHELAQVYLELGQFAEAGFCFEELVVLEPLNDVWHTLLGECLLTMGGMDLRVAANAVQARKHFSQAVKLSRRRNARALYGLAAATRAVAASRPSRRAARGAGAGAGTTAASNNATLHDVATEGLKKLFESCGATSECHRIALETFEEQKKVVRSES